LEILSTLISSRFDPFLQYLRKQSFFFPIFHRFLLPFSLFFFSSRIPYTSTPSTYISFIAPKSSYIKTHNHF
jgi:hypothetical protein